MHQVLESVALALSAIWANKLRSFMTVLGNIVAVTSIITVVSLIQGMNGMVSSAIVSDIGADSFSIQRRPPIRTEEEDELHRNNPLVTRQEADAIRRFGTAIRAVMVSADNGGNVAYADHVIERVRVTGVSAEYLDFSRFNADGAGRMMSAIEVERNRPVAIVGPELATALFGSLTPLEKVIKVGGMPFRIVGLSKPQGSFFGNSQDNFVIIPLGSHQKIFGARQSLVITVKPTSPGTIQEAMDGATAAIRVERRMRGTRINNFGIVSSETILGLYRQATTGIFAVLVGVVALSLVVGGIVIMNIMLMVVSERTREIGLRKALGARRKDIMSQVLTESVTLSTFGGLVGIALGASAAQAIAVATPLPARLEPWSVVVGVGIAAGVGLLFGLYPASRAARLDPIEALRRE
ncbi:MAG: ABC transporter permease [Vicinamibacterales bacterium]